MMGYIKFNAGKCLECGTMNELEFELNWEGLAIGVVVPFCRNCGKDVIYVPIKGYYRSGYHRINNLEIRMNAEERMYGGKGVVSFENLANYYERQIEDGYCC